MREKSVDTYIRFQPKGTDLFAHTSDGSEETLPPGYVFAYSNVNEIFGDWSPYEIGWRRKMRGYEVVTFEGAGAYNPGDWEGVAVRPTRVISRESMERWLKLQAATSSNENIKRSAEKALLNETHISKDDHDLIDALDHMSQQAEHDLDLGDFDVTEKTIRVSSLDKYDDLSSWTQWSPDELADMDEPDRHDELVSFRGSSWARRAEQWASSTVPPIIIVELLDGNVAIADGRGRTSYAIGMGWKTIPVVFLTERD